MNAFAFSALALVLTGVAAAGDKTPLMFKEWAVSKTDDGSSLAAVTALSTQAAFGEWCSFANKACSWELLVNTECRTGAEEFILANSTSGYAALKISCRGKAQNGDLYVYALNGKDLEELIRNATDASKIAFALPLHNCEFRVLRFSLDGFRESTETLQQRFPSGAQPASLNDQML